MLSGIKFIPRKNKGDQEVNKKSNVKSDRKYDKYNDTKNIKKPRFEYIDSSEVDFTLNSNDVDSHIVPKNNTGIDRNMNDQVVNIDYYDNTHNYKHQKNNFSSDYEYSEVHIPPIQSASQSKNINNIDNTNTNPIQNNQSAAEFLRQKLKNKSSLTTTAAAISVPKNSNSYTIVANNHDDNNYYNNDLYVP